MALARFGERQRGLLRLLLENKQGLTVEALGSHLGITRTAVHQHLAALQRDRLVARGELTSTGGRPGHTYVLTEEGIHLFPKQYSWFSELLVRHLKDELGSEGLRRTLRALGEQVASDLRSQLSSRTVKERIAELTRIMGELGYQAETVADPDGSLPIIDARNCVYHDLASRHEEVCELDLALLEGVVGRPVEQIECMLRGGCACRFRFEEAE